MTITESRSSARFKKIIIALGCVIAALAIFSFGVFVGYHKAGFSYRWGERYYETFGRPHGKWFMKGDALIGGHGAIGKIVKVSLPSLIIEDEGHVEKSVVITDDTMIRRFRDRINASDLSLNDTVIVIGSPDDRANIRARLIRVLPGIAFSTERAVTSSTTR